MHLAAGTSNNSTNALGMARAAQDRSIKLEQALDTLNIRLALVEGQAAAADKRFMAQCEALLAAQEEEAEKERAAAATAASAVRTQYVCQGQSGWQLACPAGSGVPTVIQALVGRFISSAPDGPCVDGRPRTQLALCPASVDLTAQVRRAAGAGTVVQTTPMELLAEAMERDPCPRSYKQLQVVYQCPAVPTIAKINATVRTERCRQALNAGAGSVGGSGMIAPAPGAAVGPVGTGVTSPQKGLP